MSGFPYNKKSIPQYGMSFRETEYMFLYLKFYINNQQKARECQKNRHTREDVTSERG